LLLCIITAAGYSQTAHISKQKLFDAFPKTIHCPVDEFNSALTAMEGQHVVLTFSEHFKFAGTVINNMVKYNNLQSLTIRSDESANTIFHLSRIINGDNSFSYTGRILNSNASDGYEIKKDLSGNYSFEKLDAEKILVECN
jgi:hypothetical protein